MKNLLLLLCCCSVLHAQAGQPGNGDSSASTSTDTTTSYQWQVAHNDTLHLATVTIEGAVPASTTLSIINLRGEEQFYAALTALPADYTRTIETTGLQPGVYYVKIDTGSEIRLRPITVQ